MTCELTLPKRSYVTDTDTTKVTTFEIPLTQGYIALVDEAGFSRFGHLKWCAAVQDRKGFRVYAKRGVVRPDGTVETIFLHRAVMDAQPGQRLDHRSRNTLDCRESNLRFATYGQNAFNRFYSVRSKHGFLGVDSQTPGSYRGRVIVDGRSHYTKTFDCPTTAAAARDELARQLHGEFAVFNNPYIATAADAWTLTTC